MERAIQKQLAAWKNRPSKLPLIIRGARQVGKTYMMKWLGENHFPKWVYFNFDERPEIKQFFENNKNINRILSSLSLISGVQIDENTLVVFDEIQECPNALNTLKYFAESEKQIPIICAGSLLGILLHSGYSFLNGKCSLSPFTRTPGSIPDQYSILCINAWPFALIRDVFHSLSD